jgi:hypothetical protein
VITVSEFNAKQPEMKLTFKKNFTRLLTSIHATSVGTRRGVYLFFIAYLHATGNLHHEKICFFAVSVHDLYILEF